MVTNLAKLRRTTLGPLWLAALLPRVWEQLEHADRLRLATHTRRQGSTHYLLAPHQRSSERAIDRKLAGMAWPPPAHARSAC